MICPFYKYTFYIWITISLKRTKNITAITTFVTLGKIFHKHGSMFMFCNHKVTTLKLMINIVREKGHIKISKNELNGHSRKFVQIYNF